MFKIGDFAKFSRVSVRMLRHYDRLGLLQPAHVDEHTDYRYYRADQLPRLNRILALKELGFTLEQIGGLLDGEVSAETLRGMLEDARAELQQQLDEDLARLGQIEARIRQIKEEQSAPDYEVVLRRVEAQRVAAMRLGPEDDVSAAFEELEAAVAGQRAEAPPLSVFDGEEGGPSVLVAVPIRGEAEAAAPIEQLDLPAVEQMACVVYPGSYGGMEQAGQALLRWIEANHFGIAGPSREVYLRFGAAERGYRLPPAYLAPSAQDFVTELQIPVERIEGENYGLLFGHRQTGPRATGRAEGKIG